jgi:alanine racemase
MESILRDTIVEVNLDNILFNIKNIRKMVGEDVAIAAVVKANGYGHGAVGISKVLMENGADCLAVATLSEAMDLRNHFKDYKIFIMGFTPDEYLHYVVKNNIISTIFSYKQAEILNELGVKNNIKPVVHIKYDTGFNRLGFKDCKESIDEIEKIFHLENIEVEGIFSHLALAGEEENQIQYTRFTNAIENLRDKGINFKYKHIEDSISAVDYPEYRMNMIRPGAIIYGIKGFHYGSLDLKQALNFKSKIYHIKKISKGEGVSYDYLWQAEEDSIIGTIPFGYADGYPRNLRDKGFVTIHGKKAPILGVICMDQCMVDLTHIPEAKVGDEVIIYGDGDNNTLDLDTASKLAGTNKNEIIARINMRPPRVYIKNGNIVNIVNYI